MTSETESRIIENAARLDNVEKLLALLIERLEGLNSAVASQPAMPGYDLEELRLNPYAILCRMASQQPISVVQRH